MGLMYGICDKLTYSNVYSTRFNHNEFMFASAAFKVI